MRLICDKKFYLSLAVLITGFAFIIFAGCKSKQTVVEQEDIAQDYKLNDKPPSVIAYPDTIKYVLPDEYMLLIFLRGDEHGHIAKTVDSYNLIMNDEGFYEYAKEDEYGNLISSGIIARNAKDRSKEEKQFLESLGN